MISLNLSDRDAETIIYALLEKNSDLKIDNIILKNKVEALAEKLNCSEIPNNSESEVGNNG